MTCVGVFDGRTASPLSHRALPPPDVERTEDKRDHHTRILEQLKSQYWKSSFLAGFCRQNREYRGVIDRPPCDLYSVEKNLVSIVRVWRGITWSYRGTRGGFNHIDLVIFFFRFVWLSIIGSITWLILKSSSIMIIRTIIIARTCTKSSKGMAFRIRFFTRSRGSRGICETWRFRLYQAIGI